MHPPIDLVEVFGRIVMIVILAMLIMMPLACMKGLDRQAEADYQECLSWQADGYPIKCDREQYR